MSPRAQPAGRAQCRKVPAVDALPRRAWEGGEGRRVRSGLHSCIRPDYMIRFAYHLPPWAGVEPAHIGWHTCAELCMTGKWRRWQADVHFHCRICKEAPPRYHRSGMNIDADTKNSLARHRTISRYQRSPRERCRRVPLSGHRPPGRGGAGGGRERWVEERRSDNEDQGYRKGRVQTGRRPGSFGAGLKTRGSILH